MLKSLMPPNGRCVKKGGDSIISTMVLGNSQVPRVYFSKNHSPIVNDIMFHILLYMIIHFSFSAEIVDVKTAFLYRDLGEIHMDCPQSMFDENKGDCIILTKYIYALGQEAWQYYEKVVELLRNCNLLEAMSTNAIMYKRVKEA